ncbi:hypothetical protein C3730_25045 [Salmonella enterica]|nr:hypothetical protein C3730_25045 [Salmonella enterica]
MAEQGWRVALLPGMPDAAQPWNEEVDAMYIDRAQTSVGDLFPKINESSHLPVSFISTSLTILFMIFN